MPSPPKSKSKKKDKPISFNNKMYNIANIVSEKRATLIKTITNNIRKVSQIPPKPTLLMCNVKLGKSGSGWLQLLS